MTEHSSQQPSEDAAPINLLMQLLRDRSKDALGPYVPGRGEFAPRWQAVAGLVKLGVAAVDPLCFALQEDDANTQRYVAHALAVVGDERAVAVLFRALQQPAIARESLLALHAILARTADTVSPDLLHQVAHLADAGHAVVEEPDTDGGYLSWNRVDHWVDYRPVKALAQQALARRGA